MIRVIFIAIAVAIPITLYILFPFIEVIGRSMHPTYRDGEILIGSRIYRKSKLKKGDVIVYKSPDGNKIVIKRIDSIEKTKKGLQLFCLGDNADESYDSRYYGFVSSKRIVCKVMNQRAINKNIVVKEV